MVRKLLSREADTGASDDDDDSKEPKTDEQEPISTSYLSTMDAPFDNRPTAASRAVLPVVWLPAGMFFALRAPAQRLLRVRSSRCNSDRSAGVLAEQVSRSSLDISRDKLSVNATALRAVQICELECGVGNFAY